VTSVSDPQADFLELRVVIGRSQDPRRVLRPGLTLVIGSGDDVNLKIEEQGVRARHARVRCEGNEAVFEAIGESVVRHNGVRSKKGTLRHGDTVELGSAVLRVQATIVAPRAEAMVAAVDAEPKALAKTPREPRALPGSEIENVATALSRVASQGMTTLSEGERREVDQHAARAGVWWRMNEMPPLELQHVWFDLNRRDDWHSLAVVPVGRRASALAVAHAFARMASLSPSSRVLVVDASPGVARATGEPLIDSMANAVTRFPGASFDFLDATALGLNEGELSHIYVPQLLNYISSDDGRHNKVIIALGDLVRNAQSIPIARNVDAALLVVEVGVAHTYDVKRVVEIIGRSRVRGAVAVERPRGT
jgi:hypothetical protein